METGSGLFHGSSVILSVWLIISANIVTTTRADITCSSCPKPVRVTGEDVHLDKRAGTGSPPKRTGPESRVFDQNSGVFAEHPGSGPVDIAFEKGSVRNSLNTKVSSDVESKNEKFIIGNPIISASEFDKVERGDTTFFRAKRSGPEPFEFTEGAWSSEGDRMYSDSSTERKNPGSLLDQQRRNRDGKVTNTKKEEPKLTSSTFALTGDSAHNHAVVYWSGQNSSALVLRRGSAALWQRATQRAGQFIFACPRSSTPGRDAKMALALAKALPLPPSLN